MPQQLGESQKQKGAVEGAKGGEERKGYSGEQKKGCRERDYAHSEQGQGEEKGQRQTSLRVRLLDLINFSFSAQSHCFKIKREYRFK